MYSVYIYVMLDDHIGENIFFFLFFWFWLLLLLLLARGKEHTHTLLSRCYNANSVIRCLRLRLVFRENKSPRAPIFFFSHLTFFSCELNEEKKNIQWLLFQCETMKKKHFPLSLPPSFCTVPPSSSATTTTTVIYIYIYIYKCWDWQFFILFFNN